MRHRRRSLRRRYGRAGHPLFPRIHIVISRDVTAFREAAGDKFAIEARMQLDPNDPEKGKDWLPTNYGVAARTYKMERQLAAPTPQIRQRTAAPVKDVISKEAMDAIAAGDNSVLNAETRKLAHEHVDQLQQQRSVAGR